LYLIGITFQVATVDRFKSDQALVKTLKKLGKTKFSEDKQMIDRIDTHPTSRGFKEIDQRSGKDRREMHTMLDPDRDKRKKNRRKMSQGGGAQDR
jgi:hypothetical protein